MIESNRSDILVVMSKKDDSKEFVVRVIGFVPAHVEYMVKASSAEDAARMIRESPQNLRLISGYKKLVKVTDVVVRDRFTGSIELARKL